MRPFAADLLEGRNRYRWDEATLALVLLALTSFHGITMTQHWNHIVGALRVFTGAGKLAAFSALMGLMIAAPLLMFWGTAHVSRWLASRASGPRRGSVPAYAAGAAVTVHVTDPSAARILRAFAYAVIPVALFYHLAHNGMHFFMEGQALLPALSDPLGWGWDLFGTAGRAYSPLLSLKSIWCLQVTLIVIGHVYGVVVANRIAGQLFHGDAILRGLAPFVVAMILYSSLSIWLIAQPMIMRSGM